MIGPGRNHAPIQGDGGNARGAKIPGIDTDIDNDLGSRPNLKSNPNPASFLNRTAAANVLRTLGRARNRANTGTTGMGAGTTYPRNTRSGGTRIVGRGIG